MIDFLVILTSYEAADPIDAGIAILARVQRELELAQKA